MNWDDVYHKLQAELQRLGGEVKRNAALSAYCTFEIGGPAAVLAQPTSIDGVVAVVRFCNANALPFKVMGLGSDLLIDDAGLDCVVVRLAENLSELRIDGTKLIAQAGASNSRVADASCAAGLSGYEFACGIPGTVGGASIMNAGAYDGEFAQVCVGLRCVDPTGSIIELTAEDAQWSYRHSMMDDAGLVVVEVTLQLKPDDPAAIRARIDELNERRAAKQPLDMPSAGSTFKRPVGYFAGKLIQDAGLRGFQLGGAQVSTKHTGFVVNAGGATSKDVWDLIAEIQKRVYENEGVEMHPEVRYWSNDMFKSSVSGPLE